MNNRRKLLVVLGAATFTPRSAFAQLKQPILIGWLITGSRSGNALATFKEGLAALGWIEGQQFVIEGRSVRQRSIRLRRVLPR